MAETIINSNQLRASGDTSSETLLNENQIRQAGDTSSKTLINPNQVSGSNPNPPSNVVFTQAGFDNGIGIGANSSSYRMYYKSTNDLAYGGYYRFVGGTGNRWCIALYVSETLSGVQALIKDSNGSYSASMSVASQPISYLGKTWYYTTTDSAMASDQSYGYINGKYLIGGEHVYTGDDRIIDAVKDLLDYVYSF